MVHSCKTLQSKKETGLAMRAGLVPDHFTAPLLLFSFLLLCPLGVELRGGDSLLVDLAGLELEYFGIVYL